MVAQKMKHGFPRLLSLIFTLLILNPTVHAQTNYVAISAKDATISIDDLNSLLLPLTQAQLEVEAAAWQQVLSQKVHDISLLEIKSRSIGQKAKLMDQAADQLETLVEASATGDQEKIEEAKKELEETGEELEINPNRIAQITENADQGTIDKADKQSEVLDKDKTDLAAKIASLRIEQGSIDKRYDTVLDALESKGGDVKQQRLYSSAVSGIKVDVDDSTAFVLGMKEWIKSDDGGKLLLINLLKFIAAIAFVMLLSRAGGRLADRISRHNAVSLLLENFIKVAVRRSILGVGLILSLPLIGINIGPVLALIGAAGLVIGLALQSTLSNFASGVLILIYRPYDINDAIQVHNVTGMVDSMTLLSTTIKTFDNQLITIPNNNVWQDTIINITGSEERRVDMVFGISYSDDFSKAQEILLKILKNHPNVLDTPEPVVRVHELGDSSVNLICRPWVKTADYWLVHWDVIETAKREFDAQGISIPFPQRDVHFFPAATAPEKV